eukprot:30497-Pelagococcus_subviridis.AAC.19
MSVRQVHALSTNRPSSCNSKLVSTGTESDTSSQQSLAGSWRHMFATVCSDTRCMPSAKKSR